jgi:hypothetical protein
MAETCCLGDKDIQRQRLLELSLRLAASVIVT